MKESTTSPCGCVVIRHGGHTNTRLCDTCKAKVFGGKAPPPEPKPDNFEDLI